MTSLAGIFRSCSQVPLTLSQTANVSPSKWMLPYFSCERPGKLSGQPMRGRSRMVGSNQLDAQIAADSVCRAR